VVTDKKVNSSCHWWCEMIRIGVQVLLLQAIELLSAWVRLCCGSSAKQNCEVLNWTTPGARKVQTFCLVAATMLFVCWALSNAPCYGFN